MVELALYRLEQAYTVWPSWQGWGVTFLLTAVFAGFTLAVLRVSRLFGLSITKLSVRHLLLLTVIAVFSPSLLEETLYRVLLLPHPGESVPLNIYLLHISVSLTLFVLAHPLLAWAAWPWARHIFYRPAFSLVVLGLGCACSFAYFYTGSVWSPVFIHWFTVIGWKFLFGGPDFNLGQRLD